MANQLFVICPFSGMESFLQDKFGNDIYFLTYSAAVLQYQEFEYISEVKQFLYRERIKTIYIVNDTSCRFINEIIRRNKIPGLPIKKAIEELYVEHFFSEFKDQPLCHQTYKLAELNIKNQIHTIMNSFLLGSHIAEFDIEIRGIITSKENKLYKEI